MPQVQRPERLPGLEEHARSSVPQVGGGRGRLGDLGACVAALRVS